MDTPEEIPKPHKRRVRYSGTHPRRFSERYKELDPDKYAAHAAHIIAKGQTPAGTRRPVCVEEILNILAPKPGETCLDATLGYGGHAERLLPRLLPGGRLFALDVDPLELPRAEARLRALGYGPDVFTARKMNFAGIAAAASTACWRTWASPPCSWTTRSAASPTRPKGRWTSG